MKIPKGGCYDEQGFASDLVILESHLHGLRLPSCHPLHNILDLLGFSLLQLHPFDLRTYLSACIVLRMTLKSLDDPYPDLMAREFLEFYGVRRSLKDYSSIATFHKRGNGQALATLKSHYSSTKVWHSKLFFVIGGD